MTRLESDHPRHQAENEGKQIIERNSQGLITRIQENTNETKYMYLKDRLMEKVKNVGVGNMDLRFITSYFYQTTESGREMVIEVTGTKINKDKRSLPISFDYAAVWIPVESDKAYVDLVNRSDGKIKSSPVVRDAYRKEYRLVHGPVVSIEEDEEVQILLGKEESALMPDFINRASYFDSEGREIEIDLSEEVDISHKAFIEEHFPKKIRWS